MGMVDETEGKADLAQLQKDAAAREARKIEEREEQRKARRERLGHAQPAEEEKPKAKPKRKSAAAALAEE